MQRNFPLPFISNYKTRTSKTENQLEKSQLIEISRTKEKKNRPPPSPHTQENYHLSWNSYKETNCTHTWILGEGERTGTTNCFVVTQREPIN